MKQIIKNDFSLQISDRGAPRRAASEIRNPKPEIVEKWELDFEWLRVQHIVQKTMAVPTLPPLDAVLFLIGVQELGRWKKAFSKEEKTDLMHIATCRLAAYDDFYEFVGRDADGWPHWKNTKTIPKMELSEQETFLKKNAVRYFKDLEKENGGFEI